MEDEEILEPAPQPKEGYKGKYKRFRCAACRAEWQKDRLYRVCGFHPGTMTFTMYNKRCATLSRLRWLLRQHGNPLFHPEFDGSYTAYSMAVFDEAGDVMGTLQGIWKRGSEWCMIMQMYIDGGFYPLSYETARGVLRDRGLENEEEVRILSADFTR